MVSLQENSNAQMNSKKQKKLTEFWMENSNKLVYNFISNINHNPHNPINYNNNNNSSNSNSSNNISNSKLYNI